MARQRRSSCLQCSVPCFAGFGLTLALAALVLQHRGHDMHHISVQELIPALPVVPSIPQPAGSRHLREQSTQQAAAEVVTQKGLAVAEGVPTTATLTSARTTIAAAMPQLPSTPETTWHCLGHMHNRSCLFRNLYYGKSGPGKEGFFMFVQKDNEPSSLVDIEVKRADKYEGFWAPEVETFTNVSELESRLSSRVLVEKSGLSLHFNPLFHHNIGHAIFDGLYPAYFALVKFGWQARVFRPVVGVAENCFADTVDAEEYGRGDVVQTYLPHPSHGRTVFPSQAKVLDVPSKDEMAKPLCEYKAGVDHGGLDLGSAPVGPADKGHKSCCSLCALTSGCLVGVFFADVCYFKGACTDGTAECFYRKEGRDGIMGCRVKHDGEVAKVKLEPVSPVDGATETRVPWYWVLGRVRKRCMAEEIYEAFGQRNEILRLFEIERACKANSDVLIRFEEIVIGVGGAGNMVADESGAIAGSLAPYNAMASFRDRMLLSYGLPVPAAEISRRTEPVPPTAPVQVIVIANKRFTESDKNSLEQVIGMANKNTFAGSNMKVEFIDWGKITGPHGKFAAHLQRVQKVDIYVSSIGTALQYVPFLRDGCVYIALGSVWGRGGRQFPTFMEQQLAGGGTPYLRTLYADPGKVLRDDVPHPPYREDGYFAAVDGDLLFQLFAQAEKLVRQGFRIPVPPEENLSKEAQILLELCREDPVGCRHMQSDRNEADKHECAKVLWNECVVYEIGPWGDGTCDINRPLLRKLRKKYGLSSYGVVEEDSSEADPGTPQLAHTPLSMDQDGKLETTWECIGPQSNRSCYFRNLYFGMDGPIPQFMIFVVGDRKITNIDMKRANKYEGFWKPIIKRFRSVEELKQVVSSHILHEVPGLSLQFNPLFSQNIGHAIFDGLYPAYVALVKFGLQHRPFRPVAGVGDDCFQDGLGLKGAAYAVGDTVETYLPDAQYERTLQPKHAKVVRMPPKVEKEAARCTFVKDMDDSGLDMGGQHAGNGLAGQRECARLCERTRRCKAAVLFAEVCYLKGPCPAGPQKCNYKKTGPYLCNLQSDSSRAQVVVRPEADKQDEQEVEVPESWVVGKVRKRCMSESIYKEFGMSGEQLLLFEIERDSRASPDVFLRFDEIVFGVGGAGNMIADDSGAIAGSLPPYNAMASFRDRMLRAYGLPIPKPGIHPLAAGEALNIIVIANKRFDASDRDKLDQIIKKSNDHGGVKAEFIDWARISSKEGKFKEHLRYVQRAHVYVSSIGTALQYVPFLRDGCAYIALGSVWGRDGRQFPTFMEQQLAGAGTPYLRTLYADPGKVLRNKDPHPPYSDDGFFAAIDEQSVSDLFRRAEAIVREGFQIPVAPYENLSVEARILLELCQEDPRTCRLMQEDRNGHVYECALLLWNEPVVYEVGPWGDGRCVLNRNKLRELRRKHGLSGYGAKED